MLLSYQRLSISCVVILLIFFFKPANADQLDTKTSNQEFASLECCQDIRGNINGDINDAIDISDLSYLVDFMFGSPSGPEPSCFEEADLDASGEIDISDIVSLVNYMFKGGSTPFSCDYVPNLDIDTKIQVKMVEDTSGSISKLTIEFETDSTYDCINYEIGYSYFAVGSIFDFSFYDIHLDGPSCITGTASATASRGFGYLPNGVYQLYFTKGLRYNFQLLVTDTTYELIGENESQFTVINPILNKAPIDFPFNLNIDTKIKVSMYEDTTGGISNLRLGFVTEKIYGCSNYRIGYSYSQSGSIFDFYFYDVHLDPIFICYTVIAAASNVKYLGNLANGTYILSLDNGAPYGFQLVVTDTTFEIIGSDERQFTISNPIYNRKL